MAKAFVPKGIEKVTGNPDGTFNINMLTTFSGSDVVGGTDITDVTAIIDGGDSPTHIRNKMTDAVLAKASSLGYSLSATNVILLKYQKGS